MEDEDRRSIRDDSTHIPSFLARKQVVLGKKNYAGMSLATRAFKSKASSLGGLIIALMLFEVAEASGLPSQQRLYRLPARLGISDIIDASTSSEGLHGAQFEHGKTDERAIEGSDDLDGYLDDSSNSSEDERFADSLIYEAWNEGADVQIRASSAMGDVATDDHRENHKGKVKMEASSNEKQAPRWPDMAFDMHERIKIVERLARLYQLSERYVPNILRARYQHDDGVKLLSDDMEIVIKAAHALKMRGWTARRTKKQKRIDQDGVHTSRRTTMASMVKETELTREEIKRIYNTVSAYWHPKMSSHTKRDARRRILAAIRDTEVAKRLLNEKDHSFIEGFARQIGPARYKQYQWQLKLPMSEVEEVYRIVLAQMIEDGINGQTRAMGIRRLGLTLNHRRAQRILQGDKGFITSIIGDVTQPMPTPRGVKARPAALDK